MACVYGQSVMRPAAAMFSDPVHALTMAQQGFSCIFLFLLGVSLRNRFRL